MEIWQGGGVNGCGLVGGKPGTLWGPILIYEGEAPNFGVSHLLVLLWQREKRAQGVDLKEGEGPLH